MTLDVNTPMRVNIREYDASFNIRKYSLCVFKIYQATLLCCTYRTSASQLAYNKYTSDSAFADIVRVYKFHVLILILTVCYIMANDYK